MSGEEGRVVLTLPETLQNFSLTYLALSLPKNHWKGTRHAPAQHWLTLCIGDRTWNE